MSDKARTYNLLFVWGVLFLALAIILTRSDPEPQFLIALTSLILLTVSYTMYTSHLRSLIPPPLPPYAQVKLQFEAPPLKDNTIIQFNVALSYPTNAKEDDIRFTIPKSIRDRAFQYLATLNTFRDSLEFEECLVKHARQLSNQLHLPPINLSVSIANVRKSPNSGIIIGHTE